LCLNQNETQVGKFNVKQKSCGFAALQQMMVGGGLAVSKFGCEPAPGIKR
jgi:hypothetical protein